MSMFKWDVVDPAPGEAVLPQQRLPWGKTIGLGAQHVVAMFGATFVFPLVMGLDANLAIMFSGLCTILFLLIVQNRVPSYLGTSASFVASVAAIRALDDGNDSSYVTGAILVGGLTLAAVGVLIHFAGAEPPTGSACRAARWPTASPWSTDRPSRGPPSCWCCRVSSRSSPRTPGTSRRWPR